MPHIIINEKLCSKCNTCGIVCITKIIEKPTDRNFPFVPEDKTGNCIKCGHCESFCTRKALTLNFNIEEKIDISPLDGQIKSDVLALYMKRRRSIRHFSSKPVDKKTILQILDVARYGVTGGNSQQVKWLVIYDSAKVNRIAELTIDWMRTLQNTSHPLANYVPSIISIWDRGADFICHQAPHLLFAHLPNMDLIDDRTDAIIGLTHFDIAAPSFGIGTCWAGFVKMAADAYAPLQQYLSLPEGRKISHAMLFGYSTYKVTSIPRRNHADISWK